MSVTGRKLYSGGLQYNLDGNATLRDRYLFDTQSPEAALTCDILPKIGSPNPHDGSLICTSHATDVAADGTVYVDVSWSTQPWAQFDKVTKDPDPRFARWTFGTVKRKIAIPAAVQTPTRVPLPDNQSVIKKPWLPYDFDITMTMATVQLETTVNKLTLGDLASLVDRCDKIHTILGKKYLFSFELGTPINDKLDVLRYQWVYDPGTPAFPVPSDSYVLPYLPRLPFSRWIRLPADNAESQPKYRTILEHDEDPNGYQILPGVII